jgi:O-antigen/teichoic acid export membrane protein
MSGSAALSAAAAPARRGVSNLLDVAAQFTATVAGRGLYLVLQIVLARALGPDGFGLYAIGWTVIGLVATLSPVGMPQAVLRYRLGGRRSLHSSAMAITLAVGCAACGAVFVTADGLAARVFHAPEAGPVIRAFAPAIPLYGVYLVLAAALRVRGAMVASATVSGLLFAAYLVLTLIAFLAGPSPTMAGHMYGAAIAVAALPAVLLLLRQQDAGAAPPLGALLHFGIVTMFINSANILNLWADRVVIGVMSDPIQVGIYQVASQLAMISIVLRNAVNVVFESAVARIGSQHGIPDLTREFHGACRMLLHISAPGLIALAVTAGFWVHLMFGADYAAAATPLVVLTIGQVLVTMAGPSITALHMSGAERLVMWMTAGSVVLNLLGNVALIPFLGSTGAALASALANLGVALACLLVCVRTGRVVMEGKWLRDTLLALAASLACACLAASLLGGLTVVTALLVLAVAYAAYAAVVATACRVEDELLERARRLLGLRPRSWAGP